MPDPLRSVLYSSEPSTPFEAHAINDLLECARSRNDALSITGLLLYTGQRFLQVLEGPSNAVDELYQTIRTDDRHHSVVTLVEEDIAKRSFPDWSMGYRLLEADDFEGFSLEKLNELCAQRPTVVLALMQSLAASQSPPLPQL